MEAMNQLLIVEFTEIVGDWIRRSLTCLNAFGYLGPSLLLQTAHGSTVWRADALYRSIPCDSGECRTVANHVFVNRSGCIERNERLNISFSSFALYIKDLALSSIKFRYPYALMLYNSRLYQPTIDSSRAKHTLAISRTERALMHRKFMTRRRDYYAMRLVSR